jgi:hypothetical protein
VLVLALIVIAFAPRIMRGRRMRAPFTGREVLFSRLVNTLVAALCVVTILTHLL